jgi:hypothetical protein
MEYRRSRWATGSGLATYQIAQWSQTSVEGLAAGYWGLPALID